MKAKTVKVVTYLGEGERTLWGHKFVAGESQDVDREDLARKCQSLGCFKVEEPVVAVAEEVPAEPTPESAAEPAVAEEPASEPEIPVDGELHPELADVLSGRRRSRRR